jgi:hypothetical protein
MHPIAILDSRGQGDALPRPIVMPDLDRARNGKMQGARWAFMQNARDSKSSYLSSH